MVAAGRPGSVPADFRAALQVLWGRGWALWPRPGSGLLTENSRVPVAEAVQGTKRRRSGARRGQPAQGSSPRPAPAARGPSAALAPRFPAPVPSSPPPQRCGRMARVAAPLLFVKQALPLGRGARGLWRVPGQDYINQSIISPEKPSTSQSKS